MTSMTVYLIPHSSVRGRQLPRSDTLFGALCWGIRLLFGTPRLEQILREFTNRSTPFLLSSMFEYTQRGEHITHYLPKPLADPYTPASFSHSPPGIDELQAVKRLNAMRTVSENDFSDILRGRKNDSHFYEECLGRTPQAGSATSRLVPVPHASTNRLTGNTSNDASFYTEERIFPVDKNGGQSGVFFCLRCRDDLVNDIKAGIHFLADTGIGAGSSTGKGHFTSINIIDELPYHEPPSSESTHVVTLSLTYPDDDVKKSLSRSWYSLERRQGKIEAMYAPVPDHVRKDSVLMLGEGSTFPQNGRHYYGMNTIVRKAGNGLDFDVWQYGYAFTVNSRHITP